MKWNSQVSREARSTDEEEVGAPKPLPPVENTGAMLKNESNDGESTEMNRMINGAVDSEGEVPPQAVNPRVKLATIIKGSEPIDNGANNWLQKIDQRASQRTMG